MHFAEKSHWPNRAVGREPEPAADRFEAWDSDAVAASAATILYHINVLTK